MEMSRLILHVNNRGVGMFLERRKGEGGVKILPCIVDKSDCISSTVFYVQFGKESLIHYLIFMKPIAINVTSVQKYSPFVKMRC